MSHCSCRPNLHPEHFACFKCRKMFRAPAWNSLPEATRLAYLEYAVKCPQCRQDMRNMGKNFRPPKHTDLKRWRRLQCLAKDLEGKKIYGDASFFMDGNRMMRIPWEWI